MRFLPPLLTIALLGCGQAPEAPAGEVGDQPGWGGPREEESAPTGRLDRSFAVQAAPAVEFEDPDGAPVSLADFRGKPLLLNLWATWCGPCVAEMPTLDALAAREKGRLQVLALSQDLDGRAKVERFFSRYRFANLEAYLDPQLAMMTELGIGTLPTTILYDAQGREVWRVTGLEDWESGHTAALIAEAFAKPEAASPEAAR